jgi:tetratricopeptide (TPR) repeat protein
LEEAKKQEERKHYTSALEEYTIAIKFNPELYEGYERRGDIRIELWKDYSGAARDYSKALANPEKNFGLYFKRAKAYLKQKEYDKGIQDLDSAIALNSSYDSLYFYRAEVNHFIRHHFDKAIPDYNKIIELNKNFTDAWLGKALCLQSMGEYQQSIADFDKLILLNENQGDVFYYRAFSKLGLRDTSGACSDWFQAERLNFPQARSALNSYCTED